MTSLELIGGITFIVLFASLVLFLSWDSRNDNGFGSRWFSPDGNVEISQDTKNTAILFAMSVFVILILLALMSQEVNIYVLCNL